MCHSAGAIYAFNTLLTHRNILHPTHPYVVFLTPWVHPKHSSTLKLLSYIPTSFFSIVPSAAKALATTLQPYVNFSLGLFDTITCKHVDPEEEEDLGPPPGVDDETYAIEGKVSRLIMPYLLEENRNGSKDEALLCLKRIYDGKNNPWGLFEDYDQAVMMLVKQEDDLAAERVSQDYKKLKVQAFFAESDMMIGKQGAAWIDQCWQQEGVAERIEYTSTTILGANHETVGSADNGAVYDICEEVVKSFAKE